MRIGATQLFFADKSVADSLAYAKATGYESLELCVRDSGSLKPDTDDAALADMVTGGGAAGDGDSVAGAGGCVRGSPLADPAVRANALEVLRKSIHIASVLGADTILATRDSSPRRCAMT